MIHDAIFAMGIALAKAPRVDTLAAARAAAGLPALPEAPEAPPPAVAPPEAPTRPAKPDVRPFVRAKGRPAAPPPAAPVKPSKGEDPKIKPIPGGRYVRPAPEAGVRHPVNAGWREAAWTPKDVRDANKETRAAIAAAHTPAPVGPACYRKRPGTGGGQTVKQTRVYFSHG